MHKGMAVDQKQINNSLDYLARSGRLKRIGRGRYEIAGYGVGIEGVGEYE
jgi:predicted transcriptional regulator of viral defense system